MNKFIFNLYEENKFHAGTKATQDIKNILINNGFINIDFKKPKNKYEKFLLSKFLIPKKFKEIKGNELLIQYPVYSDYLLESLISIMNKLHIKKIVFVHDIISLRENKYDKEIIEKEINKLNHFDVVICHNSKMGNWLKKNGVKSQIINLGIFDYLTDDIKKINKFEKKVFFAGNLSKSLFLEKASINTQIDLWGINPKENYPDNINYKGVTKPDILPSKLDTGFGLIWDGDSIEKCSGNFGNYLKYNNPHKASLYLSAGIPIIVWNQAAIADFVQENKVGFTVKSLNQIDEIISNISDEDYKIMVNNVEKVSKKIKNGEFTMNAVNKALNIIENEGV